MLTGLAREELKKILKYANLKDFKIIELKIVKDRNWNTNNEGDSIEDILSAASQPSQILRQQRLRKAYIRRYLSTLGIPVTPEQSKTDYIRICLELWQVKDDDYLWKFWTADEIDAELNRFEEDMKQSLRELKHRLREERSSPKKFRTAKRCLDRMLSTIRSIGTASASEMSSFPRLASEQQSLSSSPSDSDSDSSSSSSSVEVIEHSPRSSSFQHSTGFSPSQFPSSWKQEGSREPGSSQPQSSMDTAESSSPQEQFSVDFAEPSVPPPRISRSISESSPSGFQFSANIPKSSPSSSSSSSTSSVLTVQSTSSPVRRRTLEEVIVELRAAQPAPRSSTPVSSHKTQPSRHSLHRASDNSTEHSASREDKHQTLLSDFFKKSRLDKSSNPPFKR